MPSHDRLRVKNLAKSGVVRMLVLKPCLRCRRAVRTHNPALIAAPEWTAVTGPSAAVMTAVVLAVVLAFSAAGMASDDGRAVDVSVAAGGRLMFVRPDDFGLALHRDQLLVRTVIPPCDEGFDYCLYYFGGELAGTNFQSAGVRIQRRPDLAPEADGAGGSEAFPGAAVACLYTPPRGYVEFPPAMVRHGAVGDAPFAVSVFAPLQEGAAGSYSEGVLFRLALDDGTCFGVETRIAASRFEHFAEGAVRKFTEDQRAALTARLSDVVRAIRLVDDPAVVFFEMPETAPTD